MSLFFNFTEKSVRRVSFLFAAILCIASSCVKQDDIDNLQKQIDELKSNEIATVQQQMSGIQQSLGNLQTVDTELRGYIRTLQEQEGKLAQAEEALEGSIASLKIELSGDINAAKSDALAQLEAYKANVSSQLATLRASIDSLKSKDADLQGQISALQSYIDGDLKNYIDNGDNSVKTWASATFATLTQYNSTADIVAGIQSDIEAINASIDGLSTSVKDELDQAIAALDSDHQTKLNKAVSDCNAAIASAKEEITAAYTSAISSAIASSESSMRTWVNNQLSGYYTIAQTDSKIAALRTSLEGQLSSQKTYLEGLLSSLEAALNEKIETNADDVDACKELIAECQRLIAENATAISDNASAISQLRTDLGTTKTEITAAYQQAISTAINTLDGQLRGEIATQVSTINSSIDDAVAAVNATIDALSARVTQCEKDILDIKSDIQAMQQTIDDLSDKIATVQQQIESINVTITNLQNADAELQGFITALQNASDQADTLLSRRISAAIDSLTAKDEDLKRQIEALQEYVDGGIQSTKDWASATFLTLAQYDATIGDIAGIQAEITAINSWLGSLKDSYSSLNEALTACEQSMKSWVNEQLTGYYTIAQADANLLSLKTELEDKLNSQKNYLLGVLDSLNTVLNEKINTNASGIEECKGLIAECNTLIGQNAQAISDNDAAIAQLRTDLNNSKTEITAAYQQAIATAISTLDGQLSGEIADQVAAINSRIDSEVSAINTKIETLSSRVAVCESEIQLLKDDVNELKEKVAAILARIQSITYMPLFTDGKASVDYSYDGTIVPGVAVFDFEIRPASVAADLVQVWETALSMRSVYTVTRTSFEFVPLEIISVTADKGILTVTVSGAALKDDFYRRRCGARASLEISDGNNEIASEYVPLIPTTKDVITFNDPNLKKYMIGVYDSDNDGEISTLEAVDVTRVECPNKSVSDIAGLERCKNLTYLDISGNDVAVIDLPNMGQLETVKAYGNPVEKLVLNNDNALNALYLQQEDLNAISGTAISIDHYDQATTLYLAFSGTRFKTLSLTDSQNLTSIDITENTQLAELKASGNSLISTMNVSNFSDLTSLDIRECALTELNVETNTKLVKLLASGNHLSSVDLSNNVFLEDFSAGNNILTNVVVNSCNCLKVLDLSNNTGIASIELNNNTLLESLDISSTNLTSIDLKANTALTALNLSNTLITELDISENDDLVALDIDSTGISSLDVTDKSALSTLNISPEVKLIVRSGLNKSIYQLGQYVMIENQYGVVCESTGSLAKIISVDETSTTWGYYKVDSNAHSDSDGASNTDIIVAKSPAAKWCRSKGASWYLPAWRELKTIYNNKSVLNLTLTAIDGTLLGTSPYSSSTDSENRPSNSGNLEWVYGIDMGTGALCSSGVCLKNRNQRVRAVREI